MARSDDLVPLFTRHPAPGAGFRQGVVISWDPDTAENVVDVGGTLMVNLPCLNTSEASLLAEGDVVGVMTFGATWAILGRFIYPGTPEAVSSIQSITNRIKAHDLFGFGTRNSTAYGDLTGTDPGPEVTIRIGSSGRALVFWGAEMGQTADWQVRNNPHMAIDVTGANTIAPTDAYALNWHYEFPASGFAGHAAMQGWIQCSTFHLFSGLNAGDTTFTCKYRHDTIAPSGSVTFGTRELAVFAL